MGTNYYFDYNTCVHCGRAEKTLHIGKSSMGWCFSLHVIPDMNLNNFKDWQQTLSSPLIPGRIHDEYGKDIMVAEMLLVITDRDGKVGVGDPPSFGGPPLFEGYSSWEDFHEKNQSLQGPRGLSRHKIDGRHCIGHGEGTWDLIAGEFS